MWAGMALVLIAVASSWAPDPAASAGSHPTVIFYGDSLSAQSESYFNFFTGLSGGTVVDHVYPGSAPCSWLPQMLSDAASGTAAAAVLQFSGNAFNCMSFPTQDQYYAAYQQQTTEAAEAFAARGAHVFIIGAPVNYGDVLDANPQWDHLNEIYAAIAASVPGVTFVNAGESVESNGQFAWTLPCLSFESYCGPGGQNIVRAQDGGHFCPQDPNAGVCAGWDSGALRYGMAMAGPVGDYLSAGSAPAYEGDPLPPPDTAPTMAAGQSDPYLNVHDAMTIASPLTRAQPLVSLDGRYRAVLGNDGDLDVDGPQGPVWSTGTAGSGATQLSMDTDGDVELVAPSGVVWSTRTAGTPGDYLAMQENGQLVLYGSTGALWASALPATTSIQQAAGMAATASDHGYWLTDPAGDLYSHGDAGYYGSLRGIHLNQPIVAMAATPDGRGYWMVARDGGIFAFGDARFYGSTGGIRLYQPIVGMAATPDGGGYWLVASDGGIFAFGDARFYGSTGGIRLNQPVVGMAATATGHGYWLVASDGGIFAFGDARFYGSTGSIRLAQPVVGMAATRDGRGYWMVARDGGIFAFGDAPFHGSAAGRSPAGATIAITADLATSGYWETTSTGKVTPFDAPNYATET
jgi:hypothetical protein